MPHIDGHAAGEFCWFELATNDQAGAKRFYGALLGWAARDNPMGPNFTYTSFLLEDRDCAAAYTLMPDMLAKGIPPHWMIYVQVADADAVAAKCAELGGAVISPPMDVMDFGRMSVLQDPTGAVISVWQPKTHKGTLITGVPSTFCWGELSSAQPEKAVPFYEALFGWKTMRGDNPGDNYLHITAGKLMIGGVVPVEHRDPNMPSHWLSYFAVSDCDSAAAKANELGGKVIFGPMSMEKVGRMAYVADPQGAIFALFQPETSAQSGN
ncbi:MAG: VOC family protein [Bryobacterales bacterium]|nr:VOC family protein [Bryobacterales bacterium]